MMNMSAMIQAVKTGLDQYKNNRIPQQLEVPSNEKGNAKPLFNEGSVNAGNKIFGSPEERQKSLLNQHINPYSNDKI